MAKKPIYSFWTGVGKSIKNVAIVMGVPAVLFLLNNWVQWVPTEYQAALTPVIGFLSYLVNNYLKNKN